MSRIDAGIVILILGCLVYVCYDIATAGDRCEEKCVALGFHGHVVSGYKSYHCFCVRPDGALVDSE